MQIRVLFVDDEVQILNGLRLVMRKQRKDWHMDYAVGGEDALRLLEKNPFDVIGTDLKMPKIDGVKLLSILKTKYPKMARILLSGSVTDEDFLKALSNAHTHLKKPCNPSELKTTIRKLSSLSRGYKEEMSY